MIVISGCPRSGTSLITNSIRLALAPYGYEMLGEKFPQQANLARRKELEEKDFGTGKAAEFKKWLHGTALNEQIGGEAERVGKAEQQRRKTQKEVEDMNPHGFWECRYTVQGAIWHPGFDKIIEGKKICKIVSQGLTSTPPSCVDKMIYMIRDPLKVATSQERLGRNGPAEDFIQERGGKINDVTMFIQVSRDAARWFLLTGFTPLVIDYDEHLADTVNSSEKIIAYLGEGDAKQIIDAVDPSLNRSKAKEAAPSGADDALEIYRLMRVMDWRGVLEYLPVRHRQNKDSFMCFRSGLKTIVPHCLNCKSDPEFAKTLIEHANRVGIKWQNKFCTYECGYAPDEEIITKEESAGGKNHWVPIAVSAIQSSE